MVRAEHANQIEIYLKNYARRISNHIAVALVVYTLLLIFVVMPVMDAGSSLLPFFFLVVLVGAVIPLFRNMDRRWQALGNSDRSLDELGRRFVRDRIKLWLFTLSIPLALTLFCKISSFAV